MNFRDYLGMLMNLEIEAEDSGIDLNKIQIAAYLLEDGIIMQPEKPYIDGFHLCLDYKRGE